MSTQQQKERTFWRAYVRARADLFEQQASLYSRAAKDDPRQPATDCIRKQLDLARKATGMRVGQRSSNWNPFSTRPRASIEGAFVHLHTADIMLTHLLPTEEVDARAPYVLARLRECLSPRDERVRRAEAEFHCKVFSHRRAALANAMRTVYTIADQQHARVRSFKNALIIATIVLAVVVAVVVAVGYSAPTAIPLCFNPGVTTATPQQPQPTPGQENLACPGGKGHPAPGDVMLVALLGLLGGALSAAVAVRKLSGTSTPYAVPITLSILKLPFGALTAIAGLLVLHGQFIPGLSELDSQGQILAYAVVLGVAQQVATQFVDRRAHEVLAMEPTPQRQPDQPPSADSPLHRPHADDQATTSPDGEDHP
jgi:hypothetical protein